MSSSITLATTPGPVRRSYRRGGRLVTCGASTGFLAETDLRYVWTRELNILGSDGWGRTRISSPSSASCGGAN